MFRFLSIISDLNIFARLLAYRLKTIYSGANFSLVLDPRRILSITAHSIFAVESSAWARWKGILNVLYCISKISSLGLVRVDNRKEKKRNKTNQALRYIYLRPYIAINASHIASL
jgi:hypothetical protein